MDLDLNKEYTLTDVSRLPAAFASIKAVVDYITSWPESALYDWRNEDERVIYINNYDIKRSKNKTYMNWNDTYRTTAFDKVTEWAKWMKANTGIPYNNPPSPQLKSHTVHITAWFLSSTRARPVMLLSE